MKQLTPKQRLRMLAGAFLASTVLALGQSYVMSSQMSLEASLSPSALARRNRRLHVTSSSSKSASHASSTSRASSSSSVPLGRARPNVHSSGFASSEAPYHPSGPVIEQPRCGDGVVINESCDDGNTVSGDGCSASCNIESGFICNGHQPTECHSVCGDGQVASPKEQCDDGNTTGADGCSPYCKIEVDFTCSGSPSVCVANPVCGNGKLEGDEECDDGNLTNLDGCNNLCQIEVPSS